MEGHGGEGFLEGHAQLEAAQAKDGEGIQAGARARVEVRGQGHAAAGLDQLPRRGPVAHAEEERSTRQQHGGDVRRGHGLHARLAAEHEMVGAGRAQLRRQLRATGPAQLVGVDPGAQSEALPGFEHAPPLVRGVHTFFHKHIAEGGDPGMPAHQFRQPVLGHGAGVGLGIARKFRGQVMGRQQGHVEAPAPAPQLGVGRCEPGFGLQLQAVAGLHLQMHDAPLAEGPQPRFAGGHQLRHGRGPGGADGLADPTALGGDLLVGGAVEAAVEFARAVTPEEQVGVGIHEPRAGPGAAAVHPGRIGPGGGKVHGPADLAVVALLGLLQARQMRLEVGFACPGGAVDPLELGVAMVAAPIGAGQLGQLEGLAHMLGRGQVRTQAQVLPLTLAIDRDRLGVGQVGDDLGLVGLADLIEVGDGHVAVPDLAHDLLVAIDDLLHALFDLGQSIQAERRVAGEVVIEAVLDRRTYGHLGPGEQFLDGLGHHVAGVMADGVQRLGALPRQDLELAAARQRTVEVQKLAVQLDQQGALLQRLGDGGGDIAA
ncbi:hypothetical protein GALL_482220 [mine drainage metagenome]|uniref:Uncharacterized protein n=1 Tax=mine drainage metagenome TaxID=410659 RepID=A0A1J5PHB0_9ZZZZ